MVEISAASRAEMAAGKGTKDDFHKPDLTLLPFAALVEVTRVLEFGAKKYTRDNWRAGMPHNRLVAAAMRHQVDSLYGIDHDPETGRLVLAHAICELLFALEQQVLGFGTDDRSAAVTGYADRVLALVQGTSPAQPAATKP